MKLIKQISNCGIPYGMPDMDQRYIRTTNYINLIFIFTLALPLIIFSVFYTKDGFYGYSRFVLLIIFSVLNIVLNIYQRHLLSKISTAIMPIGCLMVFPILLDPVVYAGMFLWLPYGIMILGTIIFLIFSYEKEKNMMLGMAVFFLVFIFLFDEVLLFLFEDKNDLSFIRNNYLYYLISKIVITVFLYTTFFFFKYIYYKNRMELNFMSLELNKKYQELTVLNSSLEIMVEERTSKLMLQNERIKSLAYTNAHKLRACIATINGIFDVLKFDISGDERALFELNIKSNILELDHITQEISEELIEEV